MTTDPRSTASAPAVPTVAIIGGGSIGVAFGVCFARAGYDVRLQEPDATRRAEVAPALLGRLEALSSHGLLQDEPTDAAKRVRIVAALEEAIDGADHVQECIPERLDLKQALFGELDRLTLERTILASSSSAIPVSRFAGEIEGRSRILVAHPGNPPFLIPIIEIVPAPFTAQWACDRAAAIFEGAGLSPIRLNREVEGFVFNRLQGAVLREAYCLVRDGVVDVPQIDRIMREGLAPRWSVVGPFETVDLNTRGGIGQHAKTMGPAYARMGRERGQDDPWMPDLVARVEAQRRAALPLSQWEERVAWRDEMLMRLVAHRAAEETS